MTDSELTALAAEYEAAVAADTPVTLDELSALEVRIAARSAEIQAA